MGQMFCSVVAGIISSISSFTKSDGVRISCCARFLLPFKFSCVLINVEFKLLFPVLSENSALYLKGVASIVSGVFLT